MVLRNISHASKDCRMLSTPCFTLEKLLICTLVVPDITCNLCKLMNDDQHFIHDDRSKRKPPSTCRQRISIYMHAQAHIARCIIKETNIGKLLKINQADYPYQIRNVAFSNHLRSWLWINKTSTYCLVD